MTPEQLHSQVEENKQRSQLAYLEGAVRRLIPEVEEALGGDVAIHLLQALSAIQQVARRQGELSGRRA